MSDSLERGRVTVLVAEESDLLIMITVTAASVAIAVAVKLVLGEVDFRIGCD